VRAHTLIVRGDKDVWVEPSVSQKLASELPDCRIVNYPEAARLVPEEAPDELAALVSSFVSPHVTRAPDGSESLDEGVTEHAPPDDGTTEGEMA
jgi:hypothetical protein